MPLCSPPSQWGIIRTVYGYTRTHTTYNLTVLNLTRLRTQGHSNKNNIMKEQIYNDFVTKLLPKIQDGLVISKDYFQDLFGRYVHYLIFNDALHLIIPITLIVLSIILFLYALKVGDVDDGQLSLLLIVFGFIFFIGGINASISQISNLIKDVYVPEVRVYQEIQHFKQ